MEKISTEVADSTISFSMYDSLTMTVNFNSTTVHPSTIPLRTTTPPAVRPTLLCVINDD